MSINWDLYNTRLNINGSSKRERDLNSMQNYISKHLPDSLSYKSVKINDIDASITFTGTSGDYILISSLPNESLKCGDVVKYKNKIFLIIKINADDEVYTSGKMQECNWTLKFQSPDGTILSYPCITSDKTFSEDENDMITLGANKKSVLLSFDDNTVLLKNTDDKTWRFFIDKNTTDPTPYELIGAVDTTTFNYGDKGLIYFIVQQDQIQSDDRKDLGICNYKEPVPTPELPDPDTTTVIVKIISETNDNKVRLGLPCNFTATFTNELGEIVMDVQPEYTIDNPYNGKIVLTDNGDGTASIVVNENSYDLIGNEIELTCTELNSGFYSSIVLTIVGMW
jgi:hypothetical protein